MYEWADSPLKSKREIYQLKRAKANAFIEMDRVSGDAGPENRRMQNRRCFWRYMTHQAGDRPPGQETFA
jgi:hypothetical protein